MKHVTKLLLVIFFVSLASFSHGQAVGIKAGFNLANQQMEDNDGVFSDDFKANPGFHVGLIADFPLSMMFSFETGVLFTTKGLRVDETESVFGQDVDVKATINLYYIDIPLTAKVNLGTEDLGFYVKAGPYLGYGISGRLKSEVTLFGETETDEEDINWGTDPTDDYRRLDFGLTAGAGVVFRPVRIGVNYDYGLANVSATDDFGMKINNRVFRVSLTLLF